MGGEALVDSSDWISLLDAAQSEGSMASTVFYFYDSDENSKMRNTHRPTDRSKLLFLSIRPSNLPFGASTARSTCRPLVRHWCVNITKQSR